MEIRNDALTLYGIVMVTESEPSTGHAVVTEIFLKHLAKSQMEPVDSAGYRAEYRGLSDQWCVVRNADGYVCERGIGNRQEARTRIAGDWSKRQVAA